MTLAKVGQPAPDFDAPAYDSGTPSGLKDSVKLTDYRDQWLVFFWYPLDFTFVCPTEILALSDRYDEFRALDADVLGASTDSIYSHRAWVATPRDQNGIAGLRYPLLADKSHRIAEQYGVLLPEQGIALRGLFIIDPDGVLQYSVTHNLNIGRSVDETLRVLQALQTGGRCASDWKPGQRNLD